MKVVVGAPMIKLGEWERRWFSSYIKYNHEPKECVIASENQQLLDQIRTEYPFAKTLHFNYERPAWTQNRAFAITEARDQLRKYVCAHKEVEWLLMVDADVETPPSTIAILYDIARQGYDLVFSRRVGLILFMHRDVCESVKWLTAQCIRDHSLYLEETYQVERQIQVYNEWRVNVLKQPPIFKIYSFEAKWARHKDKPLGVY